MSSAAEDEQTSVLETVESVTLTQDNDGSIILHCPPPDEDSEPLQKKLRLSPDVQDESDEPQFSVVTLPSETHNDEDFEVTMTATADADLSEERVTQIQILHEDDDSPSPIQKTEVSPVSQAWFTTKEDKDTLANKGHKWKQGMWSKEEIDILIGNIDRYVKGRGIEEPAEIIFEMSKEERKDFYRSVALGLNRPLFAVYRRVLRMYDNRNHVGKYTPEEIEKLKSLREKHGNDWATIGAALGRSASSVKDRCRLMKDTCNTGKWSEEEERRLADVVYEMAGVSPGSAVTAGVSWATVADRVRTRSEKQCRSKWLNYLNWKHSGGTDWMKEDDLNLIRRISELEVEDENEIKWEDLAGGWSSVRSPQWLRSKWWSIKRQVANHKDIPFSGTHKHSHINILTSDSSAAASDGETITLNTGALQTFEILPSFHLQPTGTPGTYYLQTTSSQGLPLSLANNSTVTLTTGSSPSSHEHIILHSLSVSWDKVCVFCPKMSGGFPAITYIILYMCVYIYCIYTHHKISQLKSWRSMISPTVKIKSVIKFRIRSRAVLLDDHSVCVCVCVCVCARAQELSSPSVPVVPSGITSGSAVLIVPPPNISSTLTGDTLNCSCYTEMQKLEEYFFKIKITLLNLEQFPYLGQKIHLNY
uniref:Cyclin-D-binding Myb-like transcription factor 1 n=1 Tax=Mola mola TaxID=94237 RepID=A0A3Q4AT81_MOLML